MLQTVKAVAKSQKAIVKAALEAGSGTTAKVAATPSVKLTNASRRKTVVAAIVMGG